jgi:hypothetical protein
MSFGADCNDRCNANHDLGGMDGDMNNILNSGVLMVASAGNNTVDAGDTWPCYYSSDAGNKVYCAGALDSSTGTPRLPFSNFGIVVNIWAPTNIHAMPDGGSAGALTTHRGMSASCPYVAGMAAMMKAIDPTLDANHLMNLIGNAPYIAGTARLIQNDPKVDMIIEPYKAVVAAAGVYHLKPDLRITAPLDGAIIQIGSYQSVQFTAFAADVNDGPWPVAGHPVTWTSDVDGKLPDSGPDGTSMAFGFTLAPLGLRNITASGTNTTGETTSQTIAITTVFTHVMPTPVITWPPPNTTVAPGTYWLTGYAKSTDPGQLGNFSCDRLVFNGNLPAQPVPNSNGLCRAQVTLTLTTPGFGI